MDLQPGNKSEGEIEATALINQTFGMVIAMTSLRSLFETKVFDRFPVSGQISAIDLAAGSSAEADVTIRLMRPLLAMGIFEEVSPSVYRHSPMSLAFCDRKIRGYMQVGWDLWMPVYTSMHHWLKSKDFKVSNLTSNLDTPFAAKHGSSLFGFLAEHPDQAALFNNGMEHLDYPVAELYPFDERLQEPELQNHLSKNVLIDVGGGKGQGSLEILHVCPAMQGRIVLQDQASVLKEVPDEAKRQVGLYAYDFFKPQPIRDAAFYYLRNILCDWSDANCINILRNQRQALSARSRLLVAARIMASSEVDIMTAAMDVTMMTYGGAERTAEHYSALIEKAGFEVVKIWTTADTPWGIFEARIPVANETRPASRL